MKILVLGTKNCYNIERLIKAAKKRGHTADYKNYRSLMANFSEAGFDISDADNHSLKQYDAIIRRATSLHIKQVKIIDLLAQENKIVTLNDQATHIARGSVKLAQHARLSAAGIPVLRTRYYYSNKRLINALSGFGMPVILKGVAGSLGKQVFLVHNKDEARKLLSQYSEGRFLLQEYAPAREDFRIIGLDGKIIGAIKRVAKKGEFRSNVALGGSAIPVKIDRELIKLSLLIMKIQRLDFAGIDIMYWQGKPYVLEVNAMCQFEGFEQATGIDVASKVIEFIEKKYRNIQVAGSKNG